MINIPKGSNKKLQEQPVAGLNQMPVVPILKVFTGKSTTNLKK